MYAQRFPVEGNLTIAGTLPANINNLAGLPLNLMLTLKDAKEVSRDVRLRWTIVGEGVELRTSDRALLSPITLTYDIPQFINGIDLAHYFTPANFDVSGLDYQAFIQSGGNLPEGLYDVCVEVVDFIRFREAGISDVLCTFASLDALAPPRIISPEDGHVYPVAPGLFDPITIQWELFNPMTITPIDHTLYLYEINPDLSLTPDRIFAFQPPLYQTTLFMQTFSSLSHQYGLAGEPPLVHGREYLVRIKAEAPDGSLVFRNQGFSNYVRFFYGAAEEEPTEPPCAELLITGQEKHEDQRFTLSWAGTHGASGYTVDWWTLDDPTQVQTLSVTDTFVSLTDLLLDVEYVAQVTAGCGEGLTVTSEEVPFKFSSEQFEIDFECGAVQDPLAILGTTPHPGLSIGDQFLAADYVITLESVSGSSDNLSGSGTFDIHLPLGIKAKAMVSFSGIKVNDEAQMYEGEIKVSGVGVKIFPPEFGELFEGLSDFLAEEIKDKEQTLANLNEIINYLDKLKEELSYFLPETVTQAVEDAHEELVNAKAAVEAANTPEELKKAEEALKKAKDKYDDAVEIYEAELDKLLKEFQDIIRAALQRLEADLDADALAQAFADAEQTVISNYTSDYAGVDHSAELEIIEEVIEDAGAVSASDLYAAITEDYYQSEVNHVLSILVGRLVAQVTDARSVEQFNEAVQDYFPNGDLLKYVGRRIKETQGQNQELIITEVKSELSQGLIKWIRVQQSK